MRFTAIFKTSYSTANDGNLSLMLALGAPIIGAVGGAGLMALENPLVLDGWIGLTLAHVVVALLFGLSRLGADDGAKRPPGSFGAAVLGTGIASFLLLAWIALLPAVVLHGRASPSLTCSHTLKQWGIIHKMYASEESGYRFPPLSSTPGHLMMDIGEIYPEYMTNLSLMQCPKIQDPRLDVPNDSEFFAVVGDPSATVKRT